jgi:DnaJ-domain-containing protein 1
MPKNDLEELKENEVDKLTKKEEELERLINRWNQDWGVDINRNEIENLRLAYREQWKEWKKRIINVNYEVWAIQRKISTELENKIKDLDLRREIVWNIDILCEKIAKLQLKKEGWVFEDKFKIPLDEYLENIPPTKKSNYEILGVNENASENEIRKSYFRLALRWHPDKNNSSVAESRFKEISAAYQALSKGKEREEDNQTMFTREYGNWIILGTGDGLIRNSSGIELSPGNVDYCQIRREIIDDIKENYENWSIRNLNLRQYSVTTYTFLVHDSFNPTYDYLDNLIFDYGKIHWKSGFSEEEWKEIEQVVNSYQTCQSENGERLSGKWGIRGTAIVFFFFFFECFSPLLCFMKEVKQAVFAKKQIKISPLIFY